MKEDKKKKKVELQVKTSVQLKDGKKKETIDGIAQFTCFANPSASLVCAFLLAQGLNALE